jgi:hypothetical protein
MASACGLLSLGSEPIHHAPITISEQSLFRIYRIYEGTNEVQRLILAGHVLSKYESSMPPLEELSMLNFNQPWRQVLPRLSHWFAKKVGRQHLDKLKCIFIVFIEYRAL